MDLIGIGGTRWNHVCLIVSLQAAKLREEAGDSQASGHEASPISGIDVDRDDLRVKGWGIIVTRNQSVARELKPCLYMSLFFRPFLQFESC